MALAFHVILQDHVTEESCKFMSGSHLNKVTILPRLVAKGTVIIDIYWF